MTAGKVNMPVERRLSIKKQKQLTHLKDVV